jgi:hypothetical protein
MVRGHQKSGIAKASIAEVSDDRHGRASWHFGTMWFIHHNRTTAIFLAEIGSIPKRRHGVSSVWRCRDGNRGQSLPGSTRHRKSRKETTKTRSNDGAP